MIELTHIFTFEAAHFLPSAPEDSHNRRIHGHSFTVEITVSGVPDPATGLLIHFETLEKICTEKVRNLLDHRFLNEIEGFATPTLENISMRIAEILAPELPILTSVTLRRDSCGQKCRYILPRPA